jgi:hypothetical protein
MINIPETSLCVVSRDRPMSWDKETGVSCHTVLISLIIKLLVKQILNFNKLLMMLRSLPASSYIP